MLRGIDALASVVGVTLGPRGRYVASDKSYGPRIGEDGVTAVNETQFEEL
jgi:chaperonin GroEL